MCINNLNPEHPKLETSDVSSTVYMSVRSDANQSAPDCV